jgi:hypothetical protein
MQRNTCFFLVAAALVFGVALLAGCLSVPGLSAPGGFEPGKVDGVSVNLLGSEPDFSPTRGCIWAVTVQVYNTGNNSAENVQVYLELVDASSGAVRDTRTVYVGSLPSGESKTVIAELDGDCINEYNLRVVPVLV